MTDQRKGELYMLIQAVFEGFFPIIIVFAYAHITPLFGYALNISVAALFFVAVLLFRKRGYQLRQREAHKDLILTSFFITLVFLLIFIGLNYTTATNTAVIIFLQLLFSFLYFNVLGNEKLPKKHVLGAALMGAGAIVILYPDDLRLNIGDGLVLLAAMIAPIGNYFQKRSRKHVSSEAVLAFRYLFSLPFLVALAFIAEPTPSLEQLGSAMPYLGLCGLLVFGVAKIFWVEATFLLSITKAMAMASFVPALTIFFAYLLLNEVPSVLQLAAIAPILLGGYLITRPVNMR